MSSTAFRLGIDLGGTKIEIIALAADGAVALRRRISTPADYDSLIRAVAELVAGAESELGARGTAGMAIPGSESFGSGLIKNANTTYLNGRPLRLDLENILARPVRLANDANCFALSEASDGAAAGAGIVFGVIAGTGVGGGVVIDGKVLGGAHGIGGEWGHIPLPASTIEEVTAAPRLLLRQARLPGGVVQRAWAGCRFFKKPPPPFAPDRCCGHLPLGCFAQGGGGLRNPLRPSHLIGAAGMPNVTAAQIAASDHPAAIAAIDRLVDRFARAMATMVNILDPDVIVMGGGLSNVDRLYRELPPLVEKYAFNPGGAPRIVKNMHGDSSGVRGAAWLWPESTP